MRIADLVDTDTELVEPPHEPIAGEKLAALIEVFDETGEWVGPALVVHGGQSLTGSHRIAAVARSWRQIGIPRVQVGELCAAHGLDWSAILGEHGGDWYVAGCALVDLLPAGVVAELGLDLH